ncbi:MAG TPA: peroxiredoxin-like family protein [Marinagarivorans sp.]
MTLPLSARTCAALFSLLLLFILPKAYADSIPNAAEDIKPILVGTLLPDVTLKNADGNNVTLSSLVTSKPTVLIFYRGGWCPYCNTHLADLRNIEDQLNKLGFQILAISPDQPKFLKESIAKHKLGYTLLSDSNMTAAKALGLAFKVDDSTIKKYHEYGIDLEESTGQDHHLLPVPAALLVDTDAMVTFTFIAPNYKVRIDKDVLIAAAKAQLKAQQ